MKLTKKEILVILVLAVLATGLSLIYRRFGGCFGGSISPPGEHLFRDCYTRGWPMPFIDDVTLRNLGELGNYSLTPFIWFVVDILFYFFLFWINWTGLKFADARVRHK